jgi:hypothetical protein
MNRKIIHASFVAILLTGWMARAAWADPVVTDITLVSEKRISRTVFEYTYKATITNDGTTRKNVRATLNSVGSGTIIIDGIIDVGELAVNQIITPTDTFTIRQDRAFAFDRTALAWSFSGETEIIPDAPGNLGELVIYPRVIPPGSDAKVTVMIKIDTPSAFSGNPKLERLDDAYNFQSNLASLVDDGTHGDAAARDGWYSAQLSINEANPDLILIRATAPATATKDTIHSPINTITVERGANTSGPFATLQSDKLLFRNLDGTVASEVDLSSSQYPISDDTGNYVVITDRYAVPSKDQKYAGILSLSFRGSDKSLDTETDSPYGSTFTFRDVNSILWSKSLSVDASTQYYVPSQNENSNSMFSADNNHILLIEVQEENGSPRALTYDTNGTLVTEFSSKLQALYSPRISGNGRYVLLEGSFPITDGGGYGFEVFDINSGESLIQLINLDVISSYGVGENIDGKFIIWADGVVLYQLPE